VSNPRLVRLCYAISDDMCKLHEYYKTFSISKRLGIPLTVVFTRETHAPAHSNGFGPLPEKVGHLWFKGWCVRFVLR
jgi:hypothetical protein